MKISLITPALPPQVDGIGDYTANLAAELAKGASVTIRTAGDRAHAPIPGVAICPVFSAAQPRSVWEIARSVESDCPDWLILQYNPFGYGRWGLNPHLPLAMRRIRGRSQTRLALMVHEPFVPVSSVKLAIMTTWQRWQLWMLGRTADVVFFSIAPWAGRFRSWFPGRPVLHLPVGSNVPLVPQARAEARARLGIGEKTRVLGLFGSAHVSRLLDRVRGAAQAAVREGIEALVLYVGPHGPTVCREMGGIPTLAEGPLPGPEVSRRFAAMDVYLAPFVDGVSTRRTSLMTGLQHAVATVGTDGFLTDEMLRRENGRALLLADAGRQDAFCERVLGALGDPERCARVGREGQQLYRREFAWERIAGRLREALAP